MINRPTSRMIRNPSNDPRKKIRISSAVIEAMRSTIGSVPAESGGLLGYDPATETIVEYRHDDLGSTSSVTYTPDTPSLNRIINGEWKERGIIFVGMAHSHPRGYARPSSGDVEYAQKILACMSDLESFEELQVWIVQSPKDGTDFEVWPYVVFRDGAISINEMEIVPSDEVVPGHVAADSEPIETWRNDLPDPDVILDDFRRRSFESLDDQFVRIKDSFDHERVATSRVIVVGTGGSRHTIMTLTRSGVEEWVLIDPDVVSSSNLGTQAVYRDEIGKPKVEVLKAEILRVNPNARVLAVQARLLDISPEQMKRYVSAPMYGLAHPGRSGVYLPIAPRETVLWLASDNFLEAQAPGNRIGLNFGLPTMASQVYLGGLAGEIAWMHPDVTRSCLRCILVNRYDAFLKKGFRNNVGSSGSTLAATDRLGALEAQILMGLIQHGSTKVRSGKLISQLKDRNFAQVRMDPDAGALLGLKVFNSGLAIGGDGAMRPFDDTVFTEQEPEDGSAGRPICPDCGGTGKLHASRGRHTSFRITPPEAG